MHVRYEWKVAAVCGIKGAGCRNEAWGGRRGELVVVNEEGQDGSALNTRPRRRLTLSYPGLRRFIPSERWLRTRECYKREEVHAVPSQSQGYRKKNYNIIPYGVDTARERSFRS